MFSRQSQEPALHSLCGGVQQVIQFPWACSPLLLTDRFIQDGQVHACTHNTVSYPAFVRDASQFVLSPPPRGLPLSSSLIFSVIIPPPIVFLSALHRRLGAFFRQLTPQVVELYLDRVAAAFTRIIVCLGALVAVSLRHRHTLKCSPFLSGICLEIKTDPMHCAPQEVSVTKLAAWSMNVTQLYLYSY